ncbi:MYG1 exonuclease-like [Temnothorax nylanderi]|uniref:MYG1 exonuclease-like n=1 Tax=Temnothorax nylanderi TaxID=102681 RepID=UPI003A872FCA
MSKKSTVRIGTQDGSFYCSGVFACALLKLLPQYKDASIVRSRNPSVLDACDIVVNVGGEYDPSRNRYDSRMKEFQESMGTVMKNPGYNWTEKLSSAGLIYCHFGHEILRSVLPDITEDRVIDEIFKITYDTLIKEIDAIANGVPMYRSVTDLSSRVSRLSPQWYSHLHHGYNQDVNIERKFEKAMALVRDEFLEIVRGTKNILLPTRNIMRRAMESRFEIDSSGEIITMSQPLSCKEYLFHLEKEMNVSPSIKYVIFEVRPYYWIECMPVELNSSEYRMLLPEAWGGLSNDTLVEACGIEGAIHVVSGRSVGGHKNKEGAMAMARKALKIGKTMQDENRATTQIIIKNDDV